MFTLHGRVLDDLKSGYKQFGGNINDLPEISKLVGGEADFMIGV